MTESHGVLLQSLPSGAIFTHRRTRHLLIPQNPLDLDGDLPVVRLADGKILRLRPYTVVEPIRDKTRAEGKPTPRTDPLDDDRDQQNPVELDADQWSEFYAGLADFEGYLDHDHSMDG